MRPRLSSALGWVLAVAWIGVPAAGQPWHNVYSADELDNEVASVARAADGGYFGVGHFEGVGTLFKLNSTGSVAWARSYGPVRPVTVRAIPGGNVAWIANASDTSRPAALFVITDFAGALRSNVRFSVPNVQHSEVTALDVDPHDSSFWVGGNAWNSPDQREPWLAHLGASGTLLSLAAFQPAPLPPGEIQSLRVDALVPASSAGVVAVGRWIHPDLWTGTATNMFALRLDGQGKALWSRIYSEKVTLGHSVQGFVGVTRDPLSTLPGVYAVASADQICGIDRTALPCIDLFTGPVLMGIDETNGNDLWSTFLEAAKHAVVFNPTKIVRDDGYDQIAIGGSLDDHTDGNREAVLVRTRLMPGPIPVAGVLGTEEYGDGTGPFLSEVADLALNRIPSSPVANPGFVMATRQSKPGMDRPAVLTTDAAGHSNGLCEQAFDLFPAPSLIAHADLPLTSIAGFTDSFTYTLGFEDLTSISCSLIATAAKPKGAPKKTQDRKGHRPPG